MFRILLLRLWPALIPLIFYLLWLRWMKKRAARGIETPPEVLKGVRFWCIVAGFVFVILGFIATDALQPARKEGRYVPPRLENGTLVPAHSEPDAP